jgi:hypothetical protein
MNIITEKDQRKIRTAAEFTLSADKDSAFNSVIVRADFVGASNRNMLYFSQLSFSAPDIAVGIDRKVIGRYQEKEIFFSEKRGFYCEGDRISEPVEESFFRQYQLTVEKYSFPKELVMEYKKELKEVLNDLDYSQNNRVRFSKKSCRVLCNDAIVWSQKTKAHEELPETFTIKARELFLVYNHIMNGSFFFDPKNLFVVCYKNKKESVIFTTQRGGN